jgi:anti-anti-sigma factor
MEARLQKRGEITVVHISGKLTIEKNQPFRDICLKQFSKQKIVFSLDGLQFVGSSGIQSFFQTLNDVHQMNPYGVRIAGVAGDFLRLLQRTASAGVQIHADVENAMISFQENPALQGAGVAAIAPLEMLEADSDDRTS